MSPRSALGPRTRASWIITMVVVAVVVVPVVGFLIFGLWVWIVFSGGIDDALRFDRPQEGDTEVVSAARETGPPLEAAGVELGDEVRLALGEGAERLGWALVRPPCDVGQHHWKVDDDYDLVCEMAVIEMVALPDRAGFRAEMVELDLALQAAGWEPDEHHWMARVLEDYWDDNQPDSDTPGGQFVSGPETYSMDNLPEVTYHRVREGRTQRLRVGWAESHTGAEAFTDYDDRARFVDGTGEETSQGHLVAQIPRQGYAVGLTLSEVYFRK